MKDKAVQKLIQEETRRQGETIDLIASENYASSDVGEALSSIFSAKYSEGYPGKRYYAGQENIDELERLAQERILKCFNLNPDDWHVNVQPHSGAEANLAVYNGLLEPGDKIMSLDLAHGGHLSHGAKNITLVGKIFNIERYFVDKKTYRLDYNEILKIAKKEKPKLIIAGHSAYPREIDFKEFRKIADETGAYLMADVAHFIGLIIADVHPSPFPYVDVMTTTAHKTFRGPRAGFIICKKELESRINKGVFPGLQGGPHNHTIAAIAVAAEEAFAPEFKKYSNQIVKNAKALAGALIKYDFNVLTGGTDNHLMLIDLSNKNMFGKEGQEKLEIAGIVLNKNMIPYDKRKPVDPSGIRIGVPAITTRGMKEKEMEKIAGWINKVFGNKDDEKVLAEIKKEVKEFLKDYPLSYILG